MCWILTHTTVITKARVTLNCDLITNDELSNIKSGAYLQWTQIGPSWPNCSLVLCTWPMKSMKPSPDLGTPCSGQSVNWNWRTVRDWPSWGSEESVKTITCTLYGCEHLSDVFLTYSDACPWMCSWSSCKVIISKWLFTKLPLAVLTEEWDCQAISSLPSNDYCYLILDQWLWLT